MQIIIFFSQTHYINMDFKITHYKKLLLRVLLLKFNYLWISHLLMIVIKVIQF